MLQKCTSTFIIYTDISHLLNIEYLAETGHVEHVFHQWLEVSDNQFASLLCKHFIQTKEYA